MAKKKQAQPEPEEVQAPPVEPEAAPVAAAPTFEELEGANVAVRVRNVGAPFVYDLTPWGYGHRWPTGAVYTIPMTTYLECLKLGMDGVSA